LEVTAKDDPKANGYEWDEVRIMQRGQTHPEVMKRPAAKAVLGKMQKASVRKPSTASKEGPGLDKAADASASQPGSSGADASEGKPAPKPAAKKAGTPTPPASLRVVPKQELAASESASQTASMPASEAAKKPLGASKDLDIRLWLGGKIGAAPPSESTATDAGAKSCPVPPASTPDDGSAGITVDLTEGVVGIDVE